MFCFNCGKQIEDGSRFCFYCGTDQTAADKPAEPCDNTVILGASADKPVDVEPLSSEPPASLVEELSRMMKPAQDEAPAAPSVELPDIPEVPRAPIPPLEDIVPPAAPAPAPQVPVQPAAPVQPAVPVYAPAAPVAPVYAPVAPVQQPTPPRKKGWLVWVPVVAAVLLFAGGVLAFLLLGGSGHEKAVETLASVAFDGEFAQIEELAPAEYWTLCSQYNGVSPSQLTYQGDVWKFTVLPTRLQAQFGSKTDLHYDSFRMPSAMEIRSDEEGGTASQQLFKTYLALYGISTDRVGEVRKLEVEIVITGMANGIKQELCQAETLYAVEIDGEWYLMDEDGTFAVDELVEGVIEEME